jgi:Raf kinase inhibitor-like YbhB/YbcL family protein
MPFQISSPAFDDGGPIAPSYTCDGEDISPALEWRDVPEGTKSFALICDDPDAPGGTWRHWALYDIPPATARLEQAFPVEIEAGPAKQGINDFGEIGYRGPCPPRGHGVHHYRFRLLALDTERLSLPARPKCAEVTAAAEAHALGEAVLTGSYSR